MYQLLGVNTDAKTTKGTNLGYLTGILYLAPGDISGHEVCAWRNAGCTDVHPCQLEWTQLIHLEKARYRYQWFRRAHAVRRTGS